MKFLKFIFPFLFVRNWYDGSWELSRRRIVLFTAFLALIGLGIFIAFMMQAPVVYIREVL